MGLPAVWLVEVGFCGIERNVAIATPKACETELRGLGVKNLYLFGSTGRGEARDDPDVDLFFDYEKGKFGLFQLMDVKQRASCILGREVDIMTRDSLHKVPRHNYENVAAPVIWALVHDDLPMLLRVSA